ncbi:hypothetical protein E2562_008557 [Oryza meyeriana var. granulata]|uniref:Uncharacterized protein n=1 Tax=Oryza meyeriana var. granulata TaxID=110450 RepID=A0A6G1C5H0_9ORYZ|nr:hypothetical protein E2562_008557 [Oryza meyeriana var. granulata]
MSLRSNAGRHDLEAPDPASLRSGVTESGAVTGDDEGLPLPHPPSPFFAVMTRKRTEISTTTLSSRAS